MSDGEAQAAAEAVVLRFQDEYMYFRTRDMDRRARDSGGLTLNWRKSSLVGAALISVSCLPQDRILSLSQSLLKDAHIVEDPEESLGHIIRRGLASFTGIGRSGFIVEELTGILVYYTSQPL